MDQNSEAPTTATGREGQGVKKVILLGRRKRKKRRGKRRIVAHGQTGYGRKDLVS